MGVGVGYAVVCHVGRKNRLVLRLVAKLLRQGKLAESGAGANGVKITEGSL